MSRFPASQFEPQTGQVPFQVGPFQPITIYDAPGQLFSQLWDREFSLRGARNVFLAPENLTPKERDTIHTRLKAAAGNNSVTSALIDVALNPWVWLFALASPVGADSVGSIFKVASKYSARVQKNSGIWASFHMLSPNHLTRDTAIGASAADIAKSLGKVHNSPSVNHFVKAYEDLIVANGLHLDRKLNHALYTNGAQSDLAFRIGTAIQIRVEGLTAPAVRRFTTISKDTGRFTLTSEVDQTVMLAGDAKRVVSSFKGGAELDRALVRMLDGVRDQVYHSPRAFIKIVRGHSDINTLRKLKADDLGRISPDKTIMGQDESKTAYNLIVTRLKAGEKLKDIEREIQRTYMVELKQPGYFPRNVWETWKNGEKVNGNEFYMDTIFSHAVRPGKSSLLRAPTQSVRIHHHDLDRIERLGDFRLTETGRKWRDETKKLIDSGAETRVRRMNFAESTDRYTDSNARTFALFVDDIGDETLAINRATRENVPKGINYAGLGLDDGVPLKTAIVDAQRAGKGPLGGFSQADVLAGEMAVLKDVDTKRLMRNNVIPMLMGRQRLEHTIAIRALDNSKTLMLNFANSSVGKAIEGSGDFGARFIAQSRLWAELDPGLEVGRDVRLVAKWLYASHLGLNAASAILNATQPILIAAPILGAKHVLIGYREYFKDWAKYMEIRRSQGFRALSAVEKQSAMQKSFRMLDEMGVAPDDLETLERITFAKRGRSTRPASLFDRIAFEYPMKLFAQVENMNRGVTAFAVRSKWMASTGADPLKLIGRTDQASRLTLATFKAEARRLVDETQFGGHFFNTPEAFLPSAEGTGRAFGNLLANPLARQFLQFTTKQFVAVVHVLPRLESEERRLRGFLRFSARGMAFSAVAYELTKNLLQTDYSRAGFFSASTEFIPLIRDGRFDGEESPFPIPPFIQIPIDLVKGFATDDKALLGYAFARTIPGGIGLSRLLGIAPQVPDIIDPLNLQRTFVAWNQRLPNGTVPFFRGDGTLIGFEDPKVLVLKGLGADLSRFQSQGKLDRFLVAQGEEQRRARREAIIAILGNNTAKAKRIMADFKRRTGFDLTISRDQLRSALRMREVGRSERILERMPADSKEIFRDIILKSREEFQGIPRKQFESGRTIKERGPRPTTLRLDPNTIKMLQQLIEEKKQTELPGSTPGDSGFASFGMF